MFKYKIPEEIKTKLTKEFLTDFLHELIKIFNLKEPIYYDDCLAYLECTCGWVDAFQHACIKQKLIDVLMYYDELEWYDSDMFDGEVSSLMIKYGLVQE